MNLAEKYVYYDETSPTFLRWSFGRRGVSLNGRAGSIQKKKDGRWIIQVCIEYKTLQGHRVVWELHHGPIPEGLEVDHRDGNTLNNRIKNLRLVTDTVQARNKGMQKNNSTGTTGVSFELSRGVTPTWRASWVDAAGRPRSQSFSETVYGEFAQLLAIEKRVQQLSELQHYTERHGM